MYYLCTSWVKCDPEQYIWVKSLFVWLCFFIQEVSTPAKRKQQSVSVTDTTDLNLTPRKKLRTDFPASLIKDSPCKSSPRLKLQTVKETSGVRMSPRKRDEPSTTPTRGQTRAETPGRGSKTRQTKEDVAQVCGSCMLSNMIT